MIGGQLAFQQRTGDKTGLALELFGRFFQNVGDFQLQLFLELIQFLEVGNVGLVRIAIKQVDRALVFFIGQRIKDAQHGRDADAAGQQHQAFLHARVSQ